jgi:hypothetical protein
LNSCEVAFNSDGLRRLFPVGALTSADLERRKPRWSALAAAERAEDRVEQLATDLLAHFTDR